MSYVIVYVLKWFTEIVCACSHQIYLFCHKKLAGQEMDSGPQGCLMADSISISNLKCHRVNYTIITWHKTPSQF